jgi:putative endonuclease
VKTTSIGKEAEQKAAEYLSGLGYKILSKNWKTTRCEIDIVAQQKGVIYFAEVKYRSSNSQGGGLDYITPNKLKQMGFAAQIWNQHNRWEGDWRLMALAVSSDASGYFVSELIEL